MQMKLPTGFVSRLGIPTFALSWRWLSESKYNVRSVLERISYIISTRPTYLIRLVKLNYPLHIRFFSNYLELLYNANENENNLGMQERFTSSL